MEKFIEALRNSDKINGFFGKNKKKLLKYAVLCLMIVCALGAFAMREDEAAEAIEPSVPDKTTEAASGNIYVDIGGAVQEPMLAELPQGSRIEDAINAAGGLTEDADLSSINRAEFLEDGQKIYIPDMSSSGPSITSDEESNSAGDSSVTSDSAGISASAASSSGKVNINTADSSQLQTLNGVGPATAQKIIDYRNSQGKFSSIEDLKNVSGIGDKTYEKLKDYITV